uniref:7TM_GPCR_Srx domain-containing protein n=1 Tax=Parastrongyloides trichosuri TaxID=131310 RepID=A0A0N4ZK15_PARTI
MSELPTFLNLLMSNISIYRYVLNDTKYFRTIHYFDLFHIVICLPLMVACLIGIMAAIKYTTYHPNIKFIIINVVIIDIFLFLLQFLMSIGNFFHLLTPLQNLYGYIIKFTLVIFFWIPLLIILIVDLIGMIIFQVSKKKLDMKYKLENAQKSFLGYRFQLIENKRTFYVVQFINVSLSNVILYGIICFILVKKKLLNVNWAIFSFGILFDLTVLICIIMFFLQHPSSIRKLFNYKINKIEDKGIINTIGVREENKKISDIYFVQVKEMWN